LADDFLLWRIGYELEPMQEMAARQHIHLHPEGYYRMLLERTQERSSGELWSRLYTSSYAGEVIGMAIAVFHDTTATYLHGASSDRHTEVKAAHLLRWQMMRDAKAAGYTTYDFFGINPPEVTHPAYRPSWEGITRFKVGFGGSVVEYPGTFELPLSRWKYGAYRFLKRIKK